MPLPDKPVQPLRRPARMDENWPARSKRTDCTSHKTGIVGSEGGEHVGPQQNTDELAGDRGKSCKLALKKHNAPEPP